MLVEGYLNPSNWSKVNNPEIFSSQSGFKNALSKMQVKLAVGFCIFTFFTDKIVIPSV